jgi:hypothetical protein
VLEQLRTVVQIARADADVLPKQDLWPGVLIEIQKNAPPAAGSRAPGEVVGFGAGRASARASRHITFTLPQLALAASLLIAVSAGVAYVAAGRVSTVPIARENPILAQAEPLLPSTGTVERANFADAQFNQAVADLEKVLTDRRDELDPRTVLIIERNLAAIDQAIREARAALDADPANTFLNSHLADARQKKLELLRQATMLQTPSGD